jgi:hypothetical protein
MHLSSLFLSTSLALAAPPADRYFQVRVVDAATGRGVPLVELRTVHEVRYYTDNQGVIALAEPAWWGQKIFFHISSPGYEFPADGFGYRGQVLEIKPGGQVRLALRRRNLAERLYRITGADLYRDSLLLGLPVPLRQPLHHAQVSGSDSVLNALYQGKLYWFWGDTNRLSYPLGNFQVTGAVSRLPEQGGLDPAVGVDLEYFTGADSFARPMAALPGTGPTWLTSALVLKDARGQEHLYAGYVKVRGFLDIVARGLAVFQPQQQRFEKLADFPLTAPLFPQGHVFLGKENGVVYAYFCQPFPLVRVRATVEDLTRPERYEGFTCLHAGSRLDRPELDRDAAGRLHYGWKANTPVLGPAEQARWRQQGWLHEGEELLALTDVCTGERVQAHSGSVYWNDYRRRWLLIAVQQGGRPSFLGEVWYAEADTPQGPWAYARKIITHERYSFYNPKQHPQFDQAGGRYIYLEGTYSHMFSGNPWPTPRYDYNQIMYRLDLADSRLVLPVPVYALPAGHAAGPYATAAVLREQDVEVPISFFALDRPRPGAIPLYARWSAAGEPLLEKQPAVPGQTPAFYALPVQTKVTIPATLLLYEYCSADGRKRQYLLETEKAPTGCQRQPLCRVWRNPLSSLGPWRINRCVPARRPW